MLLRDLRRLLMEDEVRRVVEARIKEFESLKGSSREDLFKELCFCILAANFSAERSLRIVEEIGDDLLKLSEEELAETLRRLGHRFPSSRARYIVQARRGLDELVKILETIDDEFMIREWLVRNVKGVGYKEASHFLRNIGFKNLSIIDFHIIDLLTRYGLIKRPRSLTRRRYLEIEGLLRRISEELGISLAELDLYLWYIETGRILK
ncbi:MAG: N-glycosylase/DNA lyase [Thaumarchaeota archaeon]|nr:N-glycosylase/DNA lyase [Nitrososphaerota archaeon]